MSCTINILVPTYIDPNEEGRLGRRRRKERGEKRGTAGSMAWESK
jgi:hypothetical protein